MASKTNKVHIKKDMTNIKWVKRAKMWAKTVVKDGKQTIEWSQEKPVAQNGNARPPDHNSRTGVLFDCSFILWPGSTKANQAR